MREGYTTIAISNEVWRRINQAKQNPKETFNDVLERTEFGEIGEC